MHDPGKKNDQLVTTLAQLRQRIAELEAAESRQQQTEEALRVSETQYRHLFEAARDGILIFDAETRQITRMAGILRRRPVQ